MHSGRRISDYRFDSYNCSKTGVSEQIDQGEVYFPSSLSDFTQISDIFHPEQYHNSRKTLGSNFKEPYHEPGIYNICDRTRSFKFINQLQDKSGQHSSKYQRQYRHFNLQRSKKLPYETKWQCSIEKTRSESVLTNSEDMQINKTLIGDIDNTYNHYQDESADLKIMPQKMMMPESSPSREDKTNSPPKTLSKTDSRYVASQRNNVSREAGSMPYGQSFVYQISRGISKLFTTSESPEGAHSEDFTKGQEEIPGLLAIRKREPHKIPTCIFASHGSFLFYWMFILMFAMLYNIYTIPIRQAYFEPIHAFKPSWIIADVIADIIYILDILIESRTTFLEEGLVIFDIHLMKMNYMHSDKFWLDIFCVLPLDYAMFMIKPYPLYRLNRFVKLIKCSKQKDIIASRTIHPNLFRSYNLITNFALCVNGLASVYFSGSKQEGFIGGWAYPTPVGEFATFTRKYLKSLYWAFGTLAKIAEVEEPDTILGYCIQMGGNFMGVIFFAAILSEAASMIGTKSYSRLYYVKALNEAKTYMARNNTPPELRQYVLNYYDYAWTCGLATGGIDVGSLVFLSTKWKKTLAYETHKDTLKKVDFFAECEHDFLSELLLKMQFNLTLPLEFIVKIGEVASEMFIIAEGVVEVRSEKNKVLRHLEKGGFFGEIGLLNIDGSNRRSANVISLGYAKLFILSREDVLSTLKNYPKAQKVLESYAADRLGYGKKKDLEERLSQRSVTPRSRHKSKRSKSAVGISGRKKLSDMPFNLADPFSTKEIIVNSYPELEPCLVNDVEDEIHFNEKEIIMEADILEEVSKLQDMMKPGTSLEIMNYIINNEIVCLKEDNLESSFRSLFKLLRCSRKIIYKCLKQESAKQKEIMNLNKTVTDYETKLSKKPPVGH